MAIEDSTADAAISTGDTTTESTVDDPIIEVEDTTVKFEMDRGESRVLDSVSLDIQRQEVLGVVGESGSGKSMFASALMDSIVSPGKLEGSISYYPTANEEVDVLEFSDEELRQYRWEEVAMVFQGAMSSFNPTMTIRQHFQDTLKAHDHDVAEGMDRARDLLDDVYLEGDRVLDAYPHELSGGMSQRALIALSLVLEPKLLIMDEPTAALDLLMQRSIINLLSELRDKYEMTLLFITHDLPLIAEICDRVAVLYAFQFVERGPVADIIDGSGHPYTRALLNATPNLDAPVEEMRAIEGASPDPVNVPEGCSYHPRCDLATEECRQTDPEDYVVDSDHTAACHHWEQALEEIPLSHHEESSTNAIGGDDDDAGSTVRGGERRTDEAPVISVEDLEVHFETESGFFDFFDEPDTVRAVDGIDLDIYQNDVVALVGESGCGKTTLGKTMIGAQRPTGGTVEYRGQDIWDARDMKGDIDIPYDEIRRSLQIIHQDPGSSLNPNQKVLTSLSIPLKLTEPQMSGTERERRIYELLTKVGMEPASDYAGRYPHQLSGGEKQRVALIRALLMNPDLILADEGISALDVSLRVEMMELFLELQDSFNTSYVFISHDLSNARYITEKANGRIAVMYLGEIVEVGSPEQIINNPQHPYTKALRWATPNLKSSADSEHPLRTIDIPDPIDPPSGCRFHTRCPEAREVCTQVDPELFETGHGPEHGAACFRTLEDHEYWDSDPLPEDF